MPAHHLDDKVLHYILVGIGLGVGSFLKVGFDYFSEKFWKKELKKL
jgi:hypothetical protein